MAGEEQKQSETAATEDAGAHPTRDELAGTKAQSRSFLSAARQNFSPENLKDPSVAPVIARFLLDDCERLEQEKAEMKADYRALSRSHDELKARHADKMVIISELTAKTKNLTVNELLYFACSASGAALFPVMLEIEKLPNGHEIGNIGMVISVILVIGSIALRAWAIFR